MKSHIAHTADGVDYLVREGRGQITSVHSTIPGITKVELLVENPPEIHPAIQITFTVELTDDHPLAADIHRYTTTMVEYRMEWHRAPHVSTTTPLAELGDDDLKVNLTHVEAVQEEYILIGSEPNAWSMPH